MATVAFGASPLAPTNLAASPVAPATIQITWSDNSSNETQFYLDRTTNGFAALTQFVLGANVTNFLETNLLAGTTYWYRVRAYNSAGYSPYSNTNSATTWSGPAITQPPQSQSVVLGGDARFSVSASGTEPLSYEWRFDDLAMAGATSSSLTMASVQVTNAGNYTVKVSNAVGAVTSAVGVLTVCLPPPIILKQPESLSVLTGSEAGFNVTATGVSPLSYHWQRAGTNLADQTGIVGAASAALSLLNVETNEAGNYCVVVGNAEGTVTSSVAVLTVTLAPATPGILSQPKNTIAYAGEAVSFEVGATGTSPLSYQWLCNGTNLVEGGQFTGTTNSALTISNAQPAQAGCYSVVVTNWVGSVTSLLATLAVRPTNSIPADLLVLVNSRSTRFPDFQHYLQPYLDNFGFPYVVQDIASNSIGLEISNHAAIVIGHSQLDTNLLFLSSAAQNNILAAVFNGVGLVNFDGDLATRTNTPRYDFVQQIFGLAYGPTTAVSSVTFPATEPQGSMHYITARHAPGDVLVLRSNLSVPSFTLASGVTAVTLAGSRPLVAVHQYGQGRAVQWASYDWMGTSILGPVEGLDDVVWRSIVWAARKPVVMRGLPNLVTMRMDDVSGPFWWVHTANQMGFKPWLSLFLNSITNADAADLRELVTNGLATTSIHSFDCCSSFFYFNHGLGTAYPDSIISNNFYQGTQWHLSHGIPISKVVGPHYSEIGANAFPWLKTWGVEFVPIEIVPGTVEYATPGAPWLLGAPYRLYETPQPGQIKWPLWYADFLSVPGHPELDGQFFNCYSEVRDDASCHEWCPAHNDISGSIGRGAHQVQRELDSMVMGTLYTHEWYLIPIPHSSNQTPMTTNDWAAVLQGITNALVPYSPRYVTLDYANQYVRATRTSRIVAAAYNASGQTTITLSGKSDLDTELCLFQGEDNSISNSRISVPVFAGTNVIRTAPAPMAPVIVFQTDSLTADAGSTASFQVAAAGDEPMNYQWVLSAVSLLSDTGHVSGSGSNVLTISDILGADTGAYQVTVSNLGGSVTSTPTLLRVIDPVILTSPVSRTNHSGSATSFSISARGTAPAYQWQKDGAPISGATDQKLLLPAVSAGDAGFYNVVVTNVYGCIVSAAAELTVVPELAIQSITFTNGLITITWNAVAGQSYGLQNLEHIEDCNWTNLPLLITAVGPTASTTFEVGDSSQKFFRVFLAQ